MPVPHLNIRIVQRSKGSSAVAGAAYQAGEKLFSEYDQNRKTTAGNSPKLFTRKSCFRQTHRRNMLTGQRSGTPPKKLRSNGTHSLQGVSCLPFRGKFRLKNVRRC